MQVKPLQSTLSMEGCCRPTCKVTVS